MSLFDMVPDDYSTSFTVFLDFIQTIRARCDFKSPNAQRSVNSWKSSPVLGTVGFTYSAVPLRRIYFLFCFFIFVTPAITGAVNEKVQPLLKLFKLQFILKLRRKAGQYALFWNQGRTVDRTKYLVQTNRIYYPRGLYSNVDSVVSRHCLAIIFFTNFCYVCGIRFISTLSSFIARLVNLNSRYIIIKLN